MCVCVGDLSDRVYVRACVILVIGCVCVCDLSDRARTRVCGVDIACATI